MTYGHYKVQCSHCKIVIDHCRCDAENKPIRYEVCKACQNKNEENMDKDELVKTEVRPIQADKFRYWLHKSGRHIVYGIRVKWNNNRYVRGIVVNTKSSSDDEMSAPVNKLAENYGEIPTNEFPTAMNRVAQGLLWNSELNCYVTTYKKYASGDEVCADLAGNHYLSYAEWPLVVNGKEMWKEVQD